MSELDEIGHFHPQGRLQFAFIPAEDGRCGPRNPEVEREMIRYSVSGRLPAPES